MYNHAADKNTQIKILADLNLCDKRTIMEILRHRGIEILPQNCKPGNHTVWSDAQVRQLVELKKQGYKRAEIAAIMKVDVKRVEYKLDTIRRKGLAN